MQKRKNGKGCHLINEKASPTSAVASVVEAIIKDKNGRILLLKRSKENTFFVGKWQLPGGKVDFGENVQHAIKREIFEETGCICSNARLKKVYSFSEEFNGFSGTLFLMVFKAEISGKLCLSKDHIDYKFFKIQEIKKSTLTPVSKKAIFGK